MAVSSTAMGQFSPTPPPTQTEINLQRAFARLGFVELNASDMAQFYATYTAGVLVLKPTTISANDHEIWLYECGTPPLMMGAMTVIADTPEPAYNESATGSGTLHDGTPFTATIDVSGSEIVADVMLAGSFTGTVSGEMVQFHVDVVGESPVPLTVFFPTSKFDAAVASAAAPMDPDDLLALEPDRRENPTMWKEFQICFNNFDACMDSADYAKSRSIEDCGDTGGTFAAVIGGIVGGAGVGAACGAAFGGVGAIPAGLLGGLIGGIGGATTNYAMCVADARKQHDIATYDCWVELTLCIQNWTLEWLWEHH